MDSIKWLQIICYLALYGNLYGQDIKLTTPAAPYFSHMLLKGVGDTLSMDFRLDGTSIRYTTDGSAPTEKSKLFNHNTVISSPCMVLYRAFHPDYLPSDIGSVQYFNNTKLHYDLTVSPSNEKYNNGGKLTLDDKVFGTNDFHRNYLGYEGGKATVEVKFKKSTKVRRVNISALIQQSAWIFGPSEIVIKDNNGNVLVTQKVHSSKEISKSTCELYSVALPKMKLQSLIIEIYASSLPAWHDGADHPAWLFLDELWVD